MKRRSPLARRTGLKRTRVATVSGRLRKVGKRGSALKIMDALLRKLVLLRDGHCQWCGAGRNGAKATLQVAHIKPKGAYSMLRYELENVLLLCVRCHLYRWHKDPAAAVAWLQEARPGLLDRLTWLAQTRSKPDRKLERIMLEQALKGAA